MADDTSKRGPADRTKINLNEDYEVLYWCESLRCTKTQLIAAVKKAGVMVKDVQKALRRK